MNSYSRIYSGNAPEQVNPNMQGLFRKKTFIEKMGRDNPMGLLLGGVAVGVGAALLFNKMKKKK